MCTTQHLSREFNSRLTETFSWFWDRQ